MFIYLDEALINMLLMDGQFKVSVQQFNVKQKNFTMQCYGNGDNASHLFIIGVAYFENDVN